MTRATLLHAIGISALLASASTLRAQEAAGDILRLDPAFDAIAPAGARVEKVAGGFQFTEGPLWRPEGRLWFSDVVGNVVRAVSPAGEVEVLIRDAAGESTAPEGSYIGPNGMTAAPGGDVLLAQHWNRRIVRVAPDLSTSVYLDRFEGKRLNSPNDLAFRKQGGLYFTDPPYGLLGQDDDPEKELDFNGVFLHRDGELRVVVRDLERPNGLAFSPDGSVLYVSNSAQHRKLVLRYDVATDGTLSGEHVVADMTSSPEPGLPDGMKVDSGGNLFATGPGGVWVFSPTGVHLGTIRTPEPPANVAWGGDGRTLYITAVTSVYRVRLSVEGELAQDQPPADDWQSASSNQPGKEYPKVSSEGRVRFRIEAPGATSVGVSFRDSGEFTRGEDGAWYGVTRPLDVGFHYYTIEIAGAEVPDPNSLMYFGAMRWGSAVELPAPDQDFYTITNVPHGQLREIYFHSPSTATERRAFVYTPPGYDQSSDQRYPVLYLQHGWGENEYGWGEQGRAPVIMDNLLAAGRTRPFLIVMTYGMTNHIRFGGLSEFQIEPFETVLVKELIPYTDAHFRTLADQRHRAMAGLSMGGMETKTITLRNLDTFSHIGLFSGGSISPGDITDMAAFEKSNKLVFVSYGSREVEGGKTRRGGDPRADVEALEAAGINSHYYVSPDTAHEWQSWRRSLRELAPLLFRD